MLDAGDPATAYRIFAGHSAESPEANIDAEFHAGWIALRFLNDPARAAQHFARARDLRANADVDCPHRLLAGPAPRKSHSPDDADLRARTYYEKAAERAATYYGQLARARLGLKTIALNAPVRAARGPARDEAVRIVELFFTIHEKDLAMALANSTAQHLTDPAQIAALADVMLAQRDAHDCLIIGKTLAQRGTLIDALAFPTYGIPAYTAAENSAPPALVYAIARQESEFDMHAQSGGGARGLMQMIVATAKRTAEHLKMDFDAGRLLSDAAFSAKLGAAHLGQLLAEERGSPILVFAAYNAGGGHVKDWIDAYGRSAHARRGSDRLGGENPVHRDAQLRRARERELGDVSRELRSARRCPGLNRRTKCKGYAGQGRHDARGLGGSMRPSELARGK